MTDSWAAFHWGDLATLQYGKSLSGYESASGEYRVYGTNGPIGWHSEPLCGHPGVVIGRKGAYRGVHYSKNPFFVIDTAFYLEPKVELDYRWAYYELLTHNINSLDTGSAIPSTSRDSFYSLPVMFPPLPEQRAIAHILGTLDDQIELNRQMNQTLEAMAQALFKSWFVDFDPFRDQGMQNSPMGEIPVCWEVGRLGDVCEVTMGQSPPGETYNELNDGISFYQGIKDFSFRFPVRRVYCTMPTRFAECNEVLLSVRAPVGRLNVASERCAVGRGLAALRSKEGHQSYLYYLLSHTRSQWETFNSEGTVFGCITRRDIADVQIILPPRTIVDRFESLANTTDKLIACNEQESHTLLTIRDTLLPKLLSGEIQIQDADRFVEKAA